MCRQMRIPLHSASRSAGAAVQWVQAIQQSYLHVVFGFKEITRQYLRELYHAFQVTASDNEMAHYLPFAAKLLVKHEDWVGAVKLLVLASCYPAVAEGWVGKLPEIVALKAKLQVDLPAPLFARAWSEGQQLDLQQTVAELLATLQAELT